MSPVFRHGRLRLYLLKLLDEAPRHGYEIIRLLQDRFLGVYAPSPGTIYPRLARLEEEGLVTHDEADGRKTYRITGKGREELLARLDDLAELEESITASVRDIAREVTEDVRETVRSLREELAWAARDIHAGAGQGRAGAAHGREGTGHERARPGHGQAGTGDNQAGAGHGQARTGESREQAREEGTQRPGGGREQRGGHYRDSGEDDGPEWGEWARWAGRPGWGGWQGGAGPRGCADPRTYRDLEKLARQFTRQLRLAAWQAQAVSEDAVAELRVILDEAIDRIKAEVFGGGQTPRHPHGPGDDRAPGQGREPGP